MTAFLILMFIYPDLKFSFIFIIFFFKLKCCGWLIVLVSLDFGFHMRQISSQVMLITKSQNQAAGIFDKFFL